MYNNTQIKPRRRKEHEGIEEILYIFILRPWRPGGQIILLFSFFVLFAFNCDLYTDIKHRADHIAGRDTPLLIPAAPTGITATPSDAQITISWQPVIDADSYNIYWSNGVGLTMSSGNKVSGASLPYTHSGLINGAAYYYLVTAVNAMGESAPSGISGATPNTVAPGAPANVSASPGDSKITISWSPVSGATSYNIYWDAITGITINSNKLSNKTSPFVHSGPLVINGTMYYYKVSAVNSGGETLSLEVSARPHITSILYNSSLFGILQESVNAGSGAATSPAFAITKSSVGQSSGVEAAASVNFKNQSGFFH
ncbi:MAG: fibronectin type III domain-containing protein [Spirochaetia bacterium]|nr:fibronectin type III domain-containing protein [Spirochaetia bacterium]